MANLEAPPLVWGSGGKLEELREHIRKVAQAVQLLLAGHGNMTGRVTLAVAPATSTVITNPRIRADTVVALTPESASAAVAIGAGVLYVAPSMNQVTITHDASILTDRTFAYTLFG